MSRGWRQTISGAVFIVGGIVMLATDTRIPWFGTSGLLFVGVGLLNVCIGVYTLRQEPRP